MQALLTDQIAPSDIPIIALQPQELENWLATQDVFTQNWLKTHDFSAKPGSYNLIPSANGLPRHVILGIDAHHNLWHWAALADQLPGNQVYFPENQTYYSDAILGWLLGTYRFSQYKAAPKQYGRLRIPAAADFSELEHLAEAILLIRELINRPANDLTPSVLGAFARNTAQVCGADVKEIAGDDLLSANFPAIHAVGRACADAPRLIDISWNTKHTSYPLITLVGKGVCFDTGGLNIKTGNGMGLMKKDMGGAAHAIGLASLIMKQALPIRLRVLLPIVENSINGNAFRPQDVLPTRKGISVEIGNTDAEGRLILCDALAEADAENPDLLIDMATLTGASRVALGPDIPSFFTPSDELANALQAACAITADPLWRLPLWQGYEEYINSSVADVNNAGSNSYAGAITAALFLKKFVTNTKNWLHIDMMAWNITNKPGRPIGGEAQGIRALFYYLKTHYGQSNVAT